jgi:hypothetical protein
MKSFRPLNSLIQFLAGTLVMGMCAVYFSSLLAYAGEEMGRPEDEISSKIHRDEIQKQSQDNLQAVVERTTGISRSDLQKIAAPLDSANKQSLKELLAQAVDAEQKGESSNAQSLLQSYLRLRLSGLGDSLSFADPTYLNHEVMNWSPKAQRGFIKVLEKAAELSEQKPMPNDEAFKEALISLKAWDVYKQGCKRG